MSHVFNAGRTRGVHGGVVARGDGHLVEQGELEAGGRGGPRSAARLSAPVVLHGDGGERLVGLDRVGEQIQIGAESAVVVLNRSAARHARRGAALKLALAALRNVQTRPLRRAPEHGLQLDVSQPPHVHYKLVEDGRAAVHPDDRRVGQVDAVRHAQQLPLQHDFSARAVQQRRQAQH
jgi:hypothetical protein